MIETYLLIYFIVTGLMAYSYALYMTFNDRGQLTLLDLFVRTWVIMGGWFMVPVVALIVIILFIRDAARGVVLVRRKD